MKLSFKEKQLNFDREIKKVHTEQETTFKLKELENKLPQSGDHTDRSYRPKLPFLNASEWLFLYFERFSCTLNSMNIPAMSSETKGFVDRPVVEYISGFKS